MNPAVSAMSRRASLVMWAARISLLREGLEDMHPELATALAALDEAAKEVRVAARSIEQ